MPDEIQVIQTQHRRNLAVAWQIKPGAKILEIGCGQGDMTAVLAEAVGSVGHVTAIDCAERDYGAPLTLGQATDLIKASALGDRIDFHFNFHVLDPANAIEADQFDYAVLAHCAWYFPSAEVLQATLAQLRPWAKTLLFAEWNLTPTSFEQVPHMLAVLIQGQVEAFKTESQSNIRTPLSVPQMKEIIEAAGWEITAESEVDSNELQDADWEIRACLTGSMSEAQTLALSPALIASLTAQCDLLQELAGSKGNHALPVIALSARR